MVLSFTACTTASAPRERPPSSNNVTPTYAQVCLNEGSVCSRFTTGSVPRNLIDRPLHLPVVRSGAVCCPASRGEVVNTRYYYNYSGVGLGKGPVQLVLAQSTGDLLAGSVDLSPSDTPGWMAFKTTWISAPSYQGPFIVRAKGIDGAGRIALLDGALPGPLFVPPGPTVNDFAGNRAAIAGTYVSEPGCFAFQVNGNHFSESIVVDAVESSGD